MALDALMTGGMDLAALPDHLQSRARKIADLLSLLNHLPAPETHLSPAVLNSPVFQQSSASQPEPHHDPDVSLCDADRVVVDALMECGFDAGAVAEEVRPRAQQCLRLLGTLEALPADSTGDLLAARTLRYVQRNLEQQRVSQQIDRLAAPVSSGLSLRELIAVAAMFLIGVSLMWPMLGSARSAARQVACQANLASAGMGLSSYAADYRAAMPATSVHLGDPWWLTNQFNPDGSAKSNSAHLFVAVRTGHLNLSSLACPENSHAATDLEPGMRDWPNNLAASYSYQNQFTDRKPRLNGGHTLAILADKNPFFEPGVYHMELRYQRPQPVSFNHASRGGQNVLMTSGDVQWLTRPLVRGGADNIFHVGNNGIDHYTGREGPASLDDSFLVP